VGGNKGGGGGVMKGGGGEGGGGGLGSAPTGIENIRHQLPSPQLTARHSHSISTPQLLKEVGRQWWWEWSQSRSGQCPMAGEGR